ncbi:hypothetical protein BO71DRAFT_408083 [Aspergillus ellipticus CBS 707.79]|uniref:Nephrocystin 3-like N-terminal domain-containing protein n=1 Tax=Aspergillus ellipticus CBS 707.79 TaxID=1448320 RepID=A0A319DF84_9EURO|nr:hypothetical protein BO71DRAFT_408083 [Aspergillus ellipticus CBS 707.79]
MILVAFPTASLDRGGDSQVTPVGDSTSSAQASWPLTIKSAPANAFFCDPQSMTSGLMSGAHPTSYANEEYTVGWIYALPVELAAAKGMMDQVHGEPRTPPVEADNNTYVLGSMGKFKMVMASLPLHQPGIRIGLMVGIGAGIRDHDQEKDVRLGDVVIGSSAENGGVVIYDFGRRLADGSFQSSSVLNRPPRSLGTALAKLKAGHEMQESKIMGFIEEMLDRYPMMRKKGYRLLDPSNDRLFQSSYWHVHDGRKSCAACDPAQEVFREPRLDRIPVIHYGTIASGSVLVKDAVMRDEIAGKHGAIALEMEAAGLMNKLTSLVLSYVESQITQTHTKMTSGSPLLRLSLQPVQKSFWSMCSFMRSTKSPPQKAFSSKITISIEVHESVTRIEKVVNTEQTQKILDWITLLSFESQQMDIYTQREDETGLWLLQSEEFTRWLSQPRQTMFCPGIPGAGKTVMCSIVVNDLKARFQHDSEVQVAYVYCSYQPSRQQSTLDLLLSLLRQLAVKNSVILPGIQNFYERHMKNKTRPSLTEIQAELFSVASSYESLFIVIDALDEQSV